MTHLTEHYLDDIRRHLNDMRRRNGSRPGDEFDLMLKCLEGVSVSMAALASNAASLIEEGQRSVGAIVSAAMTSQAIWRLYVLPAVIGALGASLVMGWSTASAYRSGASERDADRAALSEQSDSLKREYEAFGGQLRTYLQTQQASLDAERARIESELPGMLLHRADQLAGAARGLVQLEAGTPGLIDILAQFGLQAKKIIDANRSLCPVTVYVGTTLMCAYPKL